MEPTSRTNGIFLLTQSVRWEIWFFSTCGL